MASERTIGTTSEEELDRLEGSLGHRFANRELLRLALTHRSWAYEQGGDTHYERLEFLGDAVLGLITSEWLYRRYGEEPEGKLAKLKSYLVSARALARYARTVALGEALRLGVGEERSGGRSKSSILADAMEAILGGVYLDGGLEAARRVVAPILESAASERRRRGSADAKSRLQERLQGRGAELPAYELVAEEGPDHEKTFVVECRAEGEVLGRSAGTSKKEAEQGAAAAALAQLDLRDGDRAQSPPPTEDNER